MNTIAPPPLYEVLSQHKQEIFKDLRVCLPATITGVGEDGTVSVLPAVMQVISRPGFPNGVDFTYPEFLSVPVFTVQGGGVGAVMPVAVGDECLLIFSDRAIDNWLKVGVAAPLPSVRMHDMSDGFALVGLNSMARPLLTPLLPFEGGICETRNPAGAKVAVNAITSLITLANGDANLAAILNALLTYQIALNALLASMTIASLTSGATQTAIAALAPDLVLIETDLALLLY